MDLALFRKGFELPQANYTLLGAEHIQEAFSHGVTPYLRLKLSVGMPKCSYKTKGLMSIEIDY